MLTIKDSYETMMTHFGGDDPHYGGRRLLDAGGNSVFTGCSYRTVDGHKCAVGCLIPDELYRPDFDEGGFGVNEVVAEVWGEEAENDKQLVSFLCNAQSIHDRCAEDGMPIFEFLRRLTELYEKEAI